MTNKDLPASAEMRDHLTLQAKRLRDRLRISLTGARNILAQAAYRCKDWDDLQQRVAKPVSGDHRLRLAAPPSEALRDYLREEEMAIARAIGNRVLANANLAGMLQTVRFVFEQQEHDILLEDLAPELKTTVWQPTRIGPDPHAVMQCHANVNGQTIKLIATRVYLPAYLNFPAHLKELAPYATNFGEPFSIMWSDPAAWLDAACRYLDIADDADDDYSAFAAPQILLDADMRRHERWFSRLLEYWERNGMYGDDDSEKFQSYLTPHGTYLVFGVPVATSSSDVSETRLDIRGMRGNASVLCHLHGQAISVEAFDIDARTGRHVGEFSEHFDQVNVSLFSHANYACPKVSKNPRTQLFFVTPSTGWDIEHAVSLDVMPEPGKELVSIKTDNMELLGALIDSIAARKVFWNTSASGLRQYFATLKTATEVDGFSLALDVCASDRAWACNLVTTTVHTRQNGHDVINVELVPEALALITTVGKKAILDAARDGLILRQEVGFADKLRVMPAWCNRLPPASTELTRQFDFSDTLGTLSIWDLWHRTRRAKYRRENF